MLHENTLHYRILISLIENKTHHPVRKASLGIRPSHDIFYLKKYKSQESQKCLENARGCVKKTALSQRGIAWLGGLRMNQLYKAVYIAT